MIFERVREVNWIQEAGGFAANSNTKNYTAPTLTWSGVHQAEGLALSFSI
jgi:hypothetical protein